MKIWLSIVLLSLAVSAPAEAKRKDAAERYYEEAVRMQGRATAEGLFELFARSAVEGHPVSQYNVAMMYSNGEGVYVDYQQAAYWFRESADQDFAPAQYRLGEMYYFGRGGLGPDATEALALFREAAGNGDIDAQMNLAMMLAAGEGGSADAQEALRWIREARRAGHPFAGDYGDALSSSADGRMPSDIIDDYWAQQQQFWVDQAARYGVREAEEAVDGGAPADAATDAEAAPAPAAPEDAARTSP